jgi:hypothetical protein
MQLRPEKIPPTPRQCMNVGRPILAAAAYSGGFSTGSGNMCLFSKKQRGLRNKVKQMPPYQ